jgi:hypothetical protein
MMAKRGCPDHARAIACCSLAPALAADGARPVLRFAKFDIGHLTASQ